MYSKAMNEKQHTSWLLAAMAAPLTQAASNCSWVSVIAVGALCLFLGYGLEVWCIGRKTGRWIKAVQWLWMLLIMAEFMHWVMHCWPNYKSYHAVPLALLALAAYAVSKGTETGARTGRVLLLPVMALFGAVLLSGVPEMRIDNIRPVWQMQTAHLISVMLIPSMGIGYGYRKNRAEVLIYGTAVAMVTAGVLSLEYVQMAASPFYELSRTVEIFNTDFRMESLVAFGMTLGYYVLLTYLIGISARAWEPEKQRARSIWISAGFVALVFISGMRLNSRLLAMGNLLVWVMLPLLENIRKTGKEGIDK